MKHGICTCEDPTLPECIYMRTMYHEFFWGPFKDKEEVVDAINTLDEADDYWDYDPFCIIYGSNPLPKDYDFGFKSVDDATKQWIFSQRKRKN
jgi:hypothetical protein